MSGRDLDANSRSFPDKPDLQAPYAASRPGIGERADAGQPEQSASQEDDDDQDDSSDTTPQAAKPKFDLFETGASDPARRGNVAAEAERPIGSGTGGKNGRVGIGRTPLSGASVASGASSRNRLSPNLTLPAAPVRSLGGGAVDARLNRPTAPLRTTLPIVSDDPFAPLGTRIGRFTVLAVSDQNAGYSSNLGERAGGRSGAFSQTALSTRIQSDWSRHAFEANALASYQRNFAGDPKSDPAVQLESRLRLDIDRLTTATLANTFEYRQQDEEDLDSLADPSQPSDLLNYSVSGELEHDFGRMLGRATLSAVRETTSDQPAAVAIDRDFDTYVSALYIGYQLSPALQPFVSGSLGRRVFDEGSDAFGAERNATVEAVRGGWRFDFTEKLSGEVAAGYAWNDPDNDAVGTTGSPTIDARLAWSPQRGTDVIVTALTTFDPDTTGFSTATLYQGDLGIRHRATARTDWTAGVSAGYRDSQIVDDDQRTLGASLGFSYWLNRSLALTGLASHDDVEKLERSDDYSVDTIKFGIRMQN